MVSRREFLKVSVAATASAYIAAKWKYFRALAAAKIPQVPLAGAAIPKYVDPLPHFAGARVTDSSLAVSMEEFQQYVLPQAMYVPDPLNPPAAGIDPTLGTYVWGYELADDLGTVKGPRLYPGFTVEAQRGIPNTMKYVNNLPVSGSIVQQYITVDQTLHWANPNGLMMDDPDRFMPYDGSPPAVVHLHGGEVPSDYDGGPDQWFTSDGIQGLGYRTVAPTDANAAIYQYPNDQEATTLWFHDHTLGATRLNVYAGLAAFYLLRDWSLEREDLPGGPSDTTVDELQANGSIRTYKPEIEVVIQDRMFDTNGQWYFPDFPALNPQHPFWQPEFLGDTIVVNGKSWPYFNVEPRRYRFRLLNGSNARFYELFIVNPATKVMGPIIWQIGSDGGLLDTPAKFDPNAAKPALTKLVIAPGERADLIIDFAGFEGQTLVVRNSGRAPYPKGAPPNGSAEGQIMQFRVGTVVSQGADPSYNPATDGSPRQVPITPIDAAAVSQTRLLTLNEHMGMPQVVNGVAYPGGPVEALVNNTKWAGKRPDGTVIDGFVQDDMGNYLSELPAVGSTEIWEIVNLTGDAHPIHLHLVQFQLLSRQAFNVNKYTKVYDGSFPGGTYEGMTYPLGVYIPAYGPPLAYDSGVVGAKLGGNPDVAAYLQGPARPPQPNETGWKDTVIMYPGEVTRILVRWASQDGSPFGFDATSGPGYVWHCHIVDHEDNEMMRPYKPV
jgi:spore coat protein A